MLKCKEVTQMASQGLDKDLSFMQRVSLKMHLFMCHTCRNYLKQITFLHQIGRDMDDHIEAHDHHNLSDDAKARIRASLK